MRKYSWIVMLASLSAMAQTPVDDFFYQSGKIYVVVAILVIIFLLLTLYLVRLDKKIAQLEKERNEA
ncbi:CcmD family protein [Bacteroidia bacterium]|jgi:CcmD family protein|nr:CcmD family protein [Bacteroidia bacterium]|tara:strand:- start:7316 stop:7516 length:201 start_codon:yes stop_codon:yes gene_type:complete